MCKDGKLDQQLTVSYGNYNKIVTLRLCLAFISTFYFLRQTNRRHAFHGTHVISRNLQRATFP